MISKPYSFTREQIDAFKEVLLEYKEPDIFEWGAGDSTRYFTRYFLAGEFTWTVVENDYGWYEKIKKWKLNNVFLIYDRDEYVESIKKTRRKYDIVFVDGIKRVKCMKEALSCLKKNGTLLLHDAYRKEYMRGMSLYRGKFLTSDKMLWKGKKCIR